MNENINLVELLKDCPKGTKFYSPIYGEVEFNEIDNVSNFPIRTKVKGNHISFTKEGYFTHLGTPECMLFPSKNQRDWSKYYRLFKDGDILSNGICICIFNEKEEDNYYGFYVGLGNIDLPDYFIDTPRNSYFTKKDTHLATEEEKEKLFQAIKDNGYKWNTETKTLEKINDAKEDKGNISDGYHTFNELYEYRLLYNASMFNELAKQGLYDVHKSKKTFGWNYSIW